MPKIMIACLFALLLTAPATASCLILGDSIALDLAAGLRGCKVVAVIGKSSSWIRAHSPGGSYDVAYISSGSNDPDNRWLVENFEATRSSITAARFVWILPIDHRASSAVQRVAASHGDRAVAFVPAGDHVHPHSISKLAAAARGGIP